MTEITNIGANAILPYDPRKLGLVIGSAEYITIEVLVSKMVRMFMGAPRGFGELAVIHAISLPFMGGAQGFAGDTDSLSASWGTQFMDGAKGIPAVLIAEWIFATLYKGFHFPWFGMKDLLITAGSKTISRPITASFYGYLPKDMADALTVVNNMVNKQSQASSLRGAGGGV